MRNFYIFILLLNSFNICGQIEGSWRLDPNPGSLVVSSLSGALGTVYWSINATEILERSCSWDDSIIFDANGNMTTHKGISTWIEDWQGTEECNTPIAPFSDGSFNYTFQNGTLTTIGLGAHIGISKAFNGGEYDSTSLVFQDSVYYTISFFNNNNSFNADINVGGNWWRFVYTKTSFNPPSSYLVNLKVDANNITVGPSGMYAGGGILGNALSVPLSDADGDGIWEGIATFPPAGGGYSFLNSPSNSSDWAAKEDLNNLPCADANNWNDRIMPALSADTTYCFLFASCAACGVAPPSKYEVTFEVHTDSLIANGDSVSNNGLFIGGGFVGENNALELTQVSNNIWSGKIDLLATGGYFSIYNGFCDLTIIAEVCSPTDINTVLKMTGPFWAWDPLAGPTAINNGDGTFTFTFSPAPTADMEYLFVLDGVQEDMVASGNASGNWSCTPVTDNFGYANRLWSVGSPDVTDAVYGSCDSCLSSNPTVPSSHRSCKEDISGQPCTDSLVFNDRTNLIGGFTQDTTIFLEFGNCEIPIISTDFIEFNNDFNLYPNPSNRVINIKSTQKVNSINIYNMLGNLVMVRKVSSNRSILDIENLTEGIYLIEVRFENKSILNSKFIKK